ncbi:MAG TPA: hypothetical protein VMS81_03065 [Methanomicrobiales archaeon]|nr:hypothetical protein [Methanomicrobiales archaeon]
MTDRVGHLFAGELNRSDLVIPAGGGEAQPSLLTLTGLSLRRLTLVGALTEIEGNAGDFVHARVADPTGTFSLRSGRSHPGVTGALAGIEPPAFVSVTAAPLLSLRARPSSPVLLPEAVAVVDRPARDTWVIATAELTLGRLETVRDALAGRDREPGLSRAITHYRINPKLLLEIADMVGTALESVAALKVRGGAIPGKDPKEIVLALLAARPKEVIPLGVVLGELGRQGIGAEAGNQAVKELLDKGECYAPRKGTLRLA